LKDLEHEQDVSVYADHTRRSFSCLNFVFEFDLLLTFLVVMLSICYK